MSTKPFPEPGMGVRSLLREALSKGRTVLLRSGFLLVFLLTVSTITLVLNAVVQLGTFGLVWTTAEPTDDYVTDTWLSLVMPVAAGFAVGVSIAWRNWREYRGQTLNGLENLARACAGALAACMEVYMGIAAIRWTLESHTRAAKNAFPDGLTLEAFQPYVEIGLVETLLLSSGIYATVEITRRACLMRKSSARTARAQIRSEFIRNVSDAKMMLTGRLRANRLKQKSRRRAQQRMDNVWGDY